MLEHFVKLSPAEVAQFKKFVASPYFNTNRKVVLLTNYLSVRYPNLDDKVLNKKVIYRFVFRNQKYNDANFRKLNSDFNSVFKRFLTELEIEGSSQLRDHLLLKSYMKFKMYENMKQVHSEIEKADHKVFSKDLFYYINLVVSEYTYYKYGIYENTKQKIKRFEAFCESADMLIIYLKLYLFQAEDILLFDKGKDLSSHYSLKKEVYSLFESNAEVIRKRHPDIFFLYHVIRINEDDSFFYELDKYFKKNKKILKGDLSEGYLKSYCNFYSNKYYEKTSRETAAVKLFRFFDDYFVRNKPKPEVLVHEHLPPATYFFAVDVALSLNKYIWADKFMEKNKIYLPELNREETYCLTKATVQFGRKDFKSALSYLTNISGKYVQYEFNQRIFRSKIYYEMNDIEGVKSQLVNLKTFINNKHTSREIASLANSILEKFNILLKIRNTDKKLRREEVIMFKNKLEAESSLVVGKNWFMEKLDELSL